MLLQTSAVPLGEDVSNISGAVIFISYIIAALLFTALILRDLFRSYRTILLNASKRPLRHRSELYQFIGLSAIGFFALSCNMIVVLVRSYQAWSYQHDVPLPMFSALIRGRDLHLWHWAKTSTLFQDFARDLCANAVQYWWTQSALLMSLVFSVFMAIEGPRRNIRHLLYFFVLEQILPLSFTQNLFFVAVLLSPLDTKSSKTTNPMFRTPHHIVKALIPSTSLLIFSYLLWTVQTSLPVSMVSIFMTRAVLFLPYLFLRPSPTKTSISTPSPYQARSLHDAYGNTYRILILGAIILHGFHTASVFLAEPNPKKAFTKIWAALNAAPAVTALGQDATLSAASGFYWFGSVWPRLREG